MVVASLALAATIIAQPQGYRIAFNVLEDQKADDYEVYTINSDGSAIANVTQNKDVAWIYYTIPGKLLFISDRNACKRCYFLYESDIDGSNIRKVSNLQLEDSWMGSRNKGKELVVTGRLGPADRYQLFIIDRATGLPLPDERARFGISRSALSPDARSSMYSKRTGPIAAK